MSEKHILVEGGLVYCSQSVSHNSPADAVPIQITSQNLVDANGGKLVATEKDNTIENINFGKCNDPQYKVPPPCKANVIWSKMYEGVLIDNNELRLLTEESEAICNVCSVPGKIKVAYHGQQATVTFDAMEEASPEVMGNINPLANPFEREEGTIEIIKLKQRPKTATLEQINSSKIR